ncbi:MAG: single-stranded-DNA-specific exonuclease RecJ [Lysobacteraceae bacterium]
MATTLATPGVSPRIRRREAGPIGEWSDRVHPVLRRIYAARGVRSEREARLRLDELHAPWTMGGLDAAVDLLCQAREQDWRILVVGDFDCDGATASAVAVRGLRLLGLQRVDFRVPHRQRHGYGLSPALVAELDAPLPDLILTVDNGIAAHAGVDTARARGIRVLVTDHHLPGEHLPAADAIVDPCLPGDGFPSRCLAGVGVVFYLLLALRARLREAGEFADAQGPDLGALLDLVALGTVADLVPLDRNNRILVEAGLRRLRGGRGTPGLVALAEVAGRETATLSAADMGFALGPRINAAGRLEDMRLGIECLLCDDLDEARAMAARLDHINRERRTRQADMLAEAGALVEQALLSARGETPPALCVYDAGWHPGVVGLVASRLKETWHRPALAFAPAGGEEADCLRGSARSINGFHVRDALAAIDALNPGLIVRFGGHAMAAGLTLPTAHLDAFREAFVAQAQAMLDPAALLAECLTDGELASDEWTRDLAEALHAGGPWGQGFPVPEFDGRFEVAQWRVVGQRHLKLRLRAGPRSEAIDAIWFDGWRDEPPPPRCHAVYQLVADDYRDRGGVQLLIRHLLPG